MFNSSIIFVIHFTHIVYFLILLFDSILPYLNPLKQIIILIYILDFDKNLTQCVLFKKLKIYNKYYGSKLGY